MDAAVPGQRIIGGALLLIHDPWSASQLRANPSEEDSQALASVRTMLKSELSPGADNSASEFARLLLRVGDCSRDSLLVVGRTQRVELAR